jgi:2-polyprenyl-3-methyl-5-hydroxy-6-metoxy-1,4-benzoquinol methylase
LSRINILSLAARRVWSHVRNLHEGGKRPLRVLDVACGGGDVAIALKKRSLRQGLPLDVEGCDISPVALDCARQAAEEAGVEVNFFQLDAINTDLPGGFDLVSTSLFLHHLEDYTAVGFLRKMASAGRAALVQDLLRIRFGYLLALVTVRSVTRSPVVHSDGLRSVRAAFSFSEVVGLAERAGLRTARVERCWPQRFSLSWRGD